MDQAIETLKKSIVEASQRIKNSVPMKQVLNEWEVVFLLGAIAKESNFVLFQGSDKFPDATLEIMVNGQPIQIKTELEYRASHYDHDPSRCDLVICWRKDIGFIKNLSIFELEQLFPNLITEKMGIINHDDMKPELKEVFYSIQDWLSKWGLIPAHIAADANTNTETFLYFIEDIKKAKSLCSLQYYNEAGYLQFKWYKNTLKDLGKEKLFLHFYYEIVKQLSTLNAKSETDYEYRLNISKNDYPLLQDILKKLDVVFEK
jgi:hypothetical protein